MSYLTRSPSNESFDSRSDLRGPGVGPVGRYRELLIAHAVRMLSGAGVSALAECKGSLGWKKSDEEAVLLRDDVFWEYGRDVVLGDRIDSLPNCVLNSMSAFELVSADFVIHAGQKVGIAVYSKNGATAESTGAALDDDEAQYIYGEKDRCHIYTGEITYVADHHIEYDVNTFGGCSGAIVFLLDMNQPTTVNPEDYGKAIAVHTGSSTALATNLGFKL
jgi:hypothetical protein